jgi:hypothetical protein
MEQLAVPAGSLRPGGRAADLMRRIAPYRLRNRHLLGGAFRKQSEFSGLESQSDSWRVMPTGSCRLVDRADLEPPTDDAARVRRIPDLHLDLCRRCLGVQPGHKDLCPKQAFRIACETQ